jgi:hypothetical protein
VVRGLVVILLLGHVAARRGRVARLDLDRRVVLQRVRLVVLVLVLRLGHLRRVVLRLLGLLEHAAVVATVVAEEAGRRRHHRLLLVLLLGEEVRGVELGGVVLVVAVVVDEVGGHVLRVHAKGVLALRGLERVAVKEGDRVGDVLLRLRDGREEGVDLLLALEDAELMPLRDGLARGLEHGGGAHGDAQCGRRRRVGVPVEARARVGQAGGGQRREGHE